MNLQVEVLNSQPGGNLLVQYKLNGSWVRALLVALPMESTVPYLSASVKTVGSRTADGHFISEGFQGATDLWQCTHCKTHLGVPAETNPATSHNCWDGEPATPKYVDQDR